MLTSSFPQASAGMPLFPEVFPKTYPNLNPYSLHSSLEHVFTGLLAPQVRYKLQEGRNLASLRHLRVLNAKCRWGGPTGRGKGGHGGRVSTAQSPG